MPKDDASQALSPLMEMAIMMNETFEALMAAGFTEDQAIKIMVQFAKDDNG